MSASDADELVRALSRTVVSTVAPEELPLFPALSAAYFRDPERALSQNTGKETDPLLGFGVETVAVIMTPMVLGVVSEVVHHFAVELASLAVQRGGDLAKSGLMTLFRSGSHAEPPPDASPLSEVQLKEIWQHAYDSGIALKLSEARARLLADSLAGSLAVHP